MNWSLRLVALRALSMSLACLAQANWPQFRGPRAGVAEDAALPDTWSATEHVAWTAEIPGRGWSSPIVWGDRVFVTTAVAEGDTEAPKSGLYLGGNRDTPSDKVHLWKVYCIDFNTGRILWDRVAHRGLPPYALHVKNSHASETPVTDGQRVYTCFGNVGLFCYDFNGNLVWSRTWDPLKTRYNWGTAASPALHKDRLYVINDNDEQSFLAALDTKTGEQVWRVDRDEKTNWATPCIWENDLRTELVTSGTGKVRSCGLRGCVRSRDMRGLGDPERSRERISFQERIVWERDSYGQQKSVSK